MMLFIICFVFKKSEAQQSINITCGNAIGSGGSAPYSIGQVVYTTNINNIGSVAQGVQHAYEIITVGLKESVFSTSIKLFPNPTTENLTLQLIDFTNEKLKYQLYDMQGKLIGIGTISAAQTQVKTSVLPADTYYINVVNQDMQNIQSFKIVKQ